MTKRIFKIALCLGAILGAGFIPGLQVPVSAGDGLVLKSYLGGGLPNNWIKGVFHDGDRLVVATTSGTAVKDPGETQFKPFVPGNGFKGVNISGWVDYKGKTWVGTEQGLNVREGGKWSVLDRFQQVQHSEESLFTDGKTLYSLAKVMYGGVLRYDGANWAIVDRGAGTGIMNNATSILTRGDELFIGTTTNGLYYFNGKSWQVLNQSNGLPGVWITSLAANDEGVWVGCYGGLALFDGEKFKLFKKDDGLPGNNISALKVVKGKLVIATMNAGLAIRQGRLFVNVTTENGLTDNRIEALEADDAGVWVGTINGLNLVEVR